MSRAKEMDLVKGSGLSPYEVDALHEVRKASSPTTISSKIKKMYYFSIENATMLDKTRYVEGVIILKKLYSFLALPNSGGFVLKFPAHISLKKRISEQIQRLFISCL